MVRKKHRLHLSEGENTSHFFPNTPVLLGLHRAVETDLFFEELSGAVLLRFGQVGMVLAMGLLSCVCSYQTLAADLA